MYATVEKLLALTSSRRTRDREKRIEAWNIGGDNTEDKWKYTKRKEIPCSHVQGIKKGRETACAAGQQRAHLKQSATRNEITLQQNGGLASIQKKIYKHDHLERGFLQCLLTEQKKNNTKACQLASLPSHGFNKRHGNNIIMYTVLSREFCKYDNEKNARMDQMRTSWPFSASKCFLWHKWCHQDRVQQSNVQV